MPSSIRISFQSDEVISYENGNFDLIGDITVKGITMRDTIIFERPSDISRDWAENEQVDFSSTLAIDRQDFEVFGGDFWSSVMENGLTQLSDDVEIELDIHCRRADYNARYITEDSSSVVRSILDEVKNGAAMRYTNEGDLLTYGDFNTIGRTLNTWDMHTEALLYFGENLKAYPDKFRSWTDLGITYLYLEQYDAANSSFEKTLVADPHNSRALEYLRLMKKLSD